MSLQRLIINSDLSSDGFKSVCDLSPGQLPAANNFHDYIGGLCGGNYMALLSFAVGAVQAAATYTVATGGSTNGQAGTLLNTTLTAVTSSADPTMGQFNISATAATQAASMVIAINTVLGTKVLATSLLGVVTITALVPGVVGNGLQISAGNLSNVTAGAFAGGSDGTAYALDLR
ncbi:MAG: hypothetical protein HC838_00030 [Spirulinaceae cyanobacterium RM2_2_10]|nr:hypothetical protein [Spirulinaceae cyanobacterium RM2_2_10]